VATTIGVLGHYGTGNLGDEATIAAGVENVRSRCATAVIYGFSVDPDDTAARHKIVAFPVCPGAGSRARPAGSPKEPAVVNALRGGLRRIPAVYAILKRLPQMWRFSANVLGEARFVVRSYRLLRGVDLLMIAGSGQLSDHFGGPWGMPYNLLRLSILARAVGTKLALVSVGAGPLAGSLSRFFISRAVGLAHYRSFRDVASRTLMEEIGAPGEKPVLPDLAHSLPLDDLDHPPHVEHDGTVIGINVFPHCDARYWPVDDAARYARYVERIATVAAELIARGSRVLLFPTQLHADPPVIEDVARAARMRKPVDLGRLRVASCRSVDELLGQIAGCDIVVATRFHGVVMALLLNKPVVALSNHPKTSDLMDDVGLGHYVLDIDGWEVKSLMERLELLQKTAAEVRVGIGHRVMHYRAALEHQYDGVLALVDAGGRAREKCWTP